MSKSYGFVEIQGVVAATDALDIMCKTADVEFVTWERKLGGRLVTIVVQGSVSAVTEAVETAKARAIKVPVASGVIANPHEEIVKLMEMSRQKFAVKTEVKAETTTKTATKTTRKRTTKTSTNPKGGNKNGTGSIGNGGDKRTGSSD